MAGGFFDQWLIDSQSIALGVEVGPLPSDHRLIFCDGDWGRNAEIATVVNSEIDPLSRGILDLNPPTYSAIPKVARQTVLVTVTSPVAVDYNRIAWVALDGPDIAWIIAGRILSGSLPADEQWDFELKISHGLLGAVASDW